MIPVLGNGRVCIIKYPKRSDSVDYPTISDLFSVTFVTVCHSDAIILAII